MVTEYTLLKLDKNFLDDIERLSKSANKELSTAALNLKQCLDSLNNKRYKIPQGLSFDEFMFKFTNTYLSYLDTLNIDAVCNIFDLASDDGYSVLAIHNKIKKEIEEKFYNIYLNDYDTFIKKLWQLEDDGLAAWRRPPKPYNLMENNSDNIDE